LTPAVSLVRVYHLKIIEGLVGPTQVQNIMFICGIVLWYAGTLKPGLSVDN